LQIGFVSLTTTNFSACRYTLQATFPFSIVDCACRCLVSGPIVRCYYILQLCCINYLKNEELHNVDTWPILLFEQISIPHMFKHKNYRLMLNLWMKICTTEAKKMYFTKKLSAY
jgi:hypothetical protein